MDRDRFQELVIRAVNELPEEFLSQLHNLDIVVEDRPTISQRRKAGTGSKIPKTRNGKTWIHPDYTKDHIYMTFKGGILLWIIWKWVLFKELQS